MGCLSAVGVAVETTIAVAITSSLKQVRKAWEHEVVTVRGDKVAIALDGVAGASTVAAGVNAIPELEVAASLSDNMGCLWSADGQALFDKAVSPHHHMDGPAEEANEVDHSWSLWIASPLQPSELANISLYLCKTTLKRW